MNSKKAKNLRRLAAGLVTDTRTEYNVPPLQETYRLVGGAVVPASMTGTIRRTKECFRSMYQNLKRAYTTHCQHGGAA